MGSKEISKEIFCDELFLFLIFLTPPSKSKEISDGRKIASKASKILDFPLPFGPTNTVKGLGSSMVISTMDLKFLIFKLFIFNYL